MMTLAMVRALAEACDAAKWTVENGYDLGPEAATKLVDAYAGAVASGLTQIYETDAIIVSSVRAHSLSTMDPESRASRLLAEAGDILRAKAAAIIVRAYFANESAGEEIAKAATEPVVIRASQTPIVIADEPRCVHGVRTARGHTCLACDSAGQHVQSDAQGPGQVAF